jgi:hypothetical protein
MRRVAAARGERLPETRSLVTTLSRWCNNHERPSEFYQDILCEALSRSRVQLGFEDPSHSEDEGGAEPEDLARVLEASNVGPLAIGQMEAKLARRGEELPSTPPTVLRRALLDDYRRVVACLGGSQPTAERRRLHTHAAQLAGMAGRRGPPAPSAREGEDLAGRRCGDSRDREGMGVGGRATCAVSPVWLAGVIRYVRGRFRAPLGEQGPHLGQRREHHATNQRNQRRPGGRPARRALRPPSQWGGSPGANP